MNTFFHPDPTQLLSHLLEQPVPRLAVVTGPSGAGKTTWCTALTDVAQACGLRIGGLLSPAVFEGSVKTGIDLTDLSSGATRRLAHRRTTPQPDAPTRRWQFEAETVRWANEVLSEITDCDLLLLDELGPLELVHGKGFTAGLEVLNRQPYRIGLTVIRPSLLVEAQRRWQVDDLIDLS